MTESPLFPSSSPSLIAFREFLSPNIRGFLTNLVTWDSVYQENADAL
jgi:hypothetical protein